MHGSDAVPSVNNTAAHQEDSGESGASLCVCVCVQLYIASTNVYASVSWKLQMNIAGRLFAFVHGCVCVCVWGGGGGACVCLCVCSCSTSNL